MKNTLRAALAAVALSTSALAGAQTTLLNVSYDVAREFYKDINVAFAASYKKSTGKDIKVDQSHAGSSAQARAVADGLEADHPTRSLQRVERAADRGHRRLVARTMSQHLELLDAIGVTDAVTKAGWSREALLRWMPLMTPTDTLCIAPDRLVSLLARDDRVMPVAGGIAQLIENRQNLLPRLLARPLLGGHFHHHVSRWNRDTLQGSALFGVGWGLCGVCPGPAIAGLGTGNWGLLWALGGIALGALVQGWRAR